MQREERVTVQGPVKKQQPDGMSHRGGGAQLTGQLISYYELRRRNKVLSIENSRFFSPSIWQMMGFQNSLDALIPKIPFSYVAEFWVRVTSGARGQSW